MVNTGSFHNGRSRFAGSRVVITVEHSRRSDTLFLWDEIISFNLFVFPKCHIILWLSDYQCVGVCCYHLMSGKRRRGFPDPQFTIRPWYCRLMFCQQFVLRILFQRVARKLCAGFNLKLLLANSSIWVFKRTVVGKYLGDILSKMTMDVQK